MTDTLASHTRSIHYHISHTVVVWHKLMTTGTRMLICTYIHRHSVHHTALCTALRACPTPLASQTTRPALFPSLGRVFVLQLELEQDVDTSLFHVGA